jgi:oligosaccharide translocation protein RFT1
MSTSSDDCEQSPDGNVSVDTASKLIEASISSGSALIALQFFSRLLTFLLNQALVRIASPQVFGTAAIQFELLLSSIITLSRDGVRNALHRESQLSSRPRLAVATNLAVLPSVIGFPLSLTTTYLYYQYAGVDTKGQPHFRLAIALYALAAMIELFSEPLHTR